MRPGYLSLRPGEWGERSHKVAILGSGEHWVLLDQPSPSGENPPSPEKTTVILQAALRKRLEEDQPSYRSFLGDGATAVFDLPCSGPAIFVGSREALSALREDYGSSHWKFRFLLLARRGPSDSPISCSLPVAVHNSEDRSLISHTTGKRAETRFSRILQGSTLELWEAQTAFLRPDQIRLHAAEIGIQIAGENRYGDHEPITRPDLPGTRRPGGKGFVLFSAPAVHLLELAIPSLGENPFFSAPPKSFVKWVQANSPEEKDLQELLDPLF